MLCHLLRSSTNFKMKAQAYVSQMWIASCMDEVCEGSTSQERSFVMGWPTCNCVATFRYTHEHTSNEVFVMSRCNRGQLAEAHKAAPISFSFQGIGISTTKLKDRLHYYTLL